MQKGLCTNPSNKQGAEYTNSGVYHGSVWRESRKCQREPALHAGAGKALENCRQRLQLQDLPWTDQNFTLSLPAPGPTSPTSAVSFPPRVLIIKDEKGIKLPMLLGQERENSYKLQLGRNLASDPPRWTSCFSLPLYPLRFTGASWAIEQGQGPEAWLLQPQPQEPLASRRLVSAQQRSRCLKGRREMGFMLWGRLDQNNK